VVFLPLHAECIDLVEREAVFLSGADLRVLQLTALQLVDLGGQFNHSFLTPVLRLLQLEQLSPQVAALLLKITDSLLLAGHLQFQLLVFGLGLVEGQLGAF
jgi:hypothetical protein